MMDSRAGTKVWWQRGASGVALLAMGWSGVACQAELLGPGGTGDPGALLDDDGKLPTGQAVPNECLDGTAPLSVGLSKLRRLTRYQMDAVVFDLAGLSARSAETLSPDEKMGPFYSNALAPVTELLVQQSGELAARVAQEALPMRGTLVPCDLDADTASTCAAQFVREFAGRAFRRPLSEEEVSALVGLYELARGPGGVDAGFVLLVEAILSSPSFLYHVETGVSSAPSSVPEPLDNHSLASRLSFFLWNSIPDATLLALAESGQLADPQILAQEVTRMLSDPRARTTISLFHRSWLGISGITEIGKDPALYPEFGPELAKDMEDDLGQFSTHVVLNDDSKLSTLFSASYGFPSAALAPIYGSAASEGGAPVPLNEGERKGILTRPAFLAKHAHGNQSSPVHRGIIVRENVLCQPIEPPPPNVAATVPPVDAATTTRERFSAHVASPACAGCHDLIDPPGLAFEHYDAVGRYRTNDGLSSVDASGELIAVQDDLGGAFQNAIELTAKLAQSSEVRDCYSRQWFRFALGRIESEDDICSTFGIYQKFVESGGDVKELLRSIATSDAFRNIRSTLGEGGN